MRLAGLTAEGTAVVEELIGARRRLHGDAGTALPPETFLVRDGAPAGEMGVAVPGIGDAGVALSERETFLGPAWVLELRRDGKEAEPAWAYPAQIGATKSRWYAAGEHLWIELYGPGPGVRCVALDADLRELATRALDSDGVALLREGKHLEAEGVLRRAVELSPRDPTALYNLACALALQGKADAAMEPLTAALSLDRQRLTMTARRDTDLDSLREREDFKKLVLPAGKNATP